MQLQRDRTWIGGPDDSEPDMTGVSAHADFPIDKITAVDRICHIDHSFIARCTRPALRDSLQHKFKFALADITAGAQPRNRELAASSRIFSQLCPAPVVAP